MAQLHRRGTPSRVWSDTPAPEDSHRKDPRCSSREGHRKPNHTSSIRRQTELGVERTVTGAVVHDLIS